GMQAVVDAGTMALAQLPANIQAQPRAPAACGKEGFEQGLFGVVADELAIAAHRQDQWAGAFGALLPLQADQDGTGLAAVVAQGVVQQVDQHAVQVVGLEADPGGGAAQWWGAG